MTLCV